MFQQLYCAWPVYRQTKKENLLSKKKKERKPVIKKRKNRKKTKTLSRGSHVQVLQIIRGINFGVNNYPVPGEIPKVSVEYKNELGSS